MKNVWKKEKYSKINIAIEGNVGIDYEINNEEIFDIGYGEQGVAENETSCELFIIPKTSGTTNLRLNFIDHMIEEIVETREYIITINEDMNVEYKEIDM